MTESFQLLYSNARTINDLSALSVGFLKGVLEGTPHHLGGIEQETLDIMDGLVELNLHQFVTVNSQPGVDEPQTQQKAYVNGFLHKRFKEQLHHFLEQQQNVCYYMTLDTSGSMEGNIPFQNYGRPFLTYPVTRERNNNMIAWNNVTQITNSFEKNIGVFSDYKKYSSLFELLNTDYMLVVVVARNWNKGNLEELLLQFLRHTLVLPRLELTFSEMNSIPNIIALLLSLQQNGFSTSEVHAIKEMIPSRIDMTPELAVKIHRTGYRPAVTSMMNLMFWYTVMSNLQELYQPTAFKVLDKVFSIIPELSLMWKWSDMSDQDKQNLVRAMELYISPVYDPHPLLWNKSLRLSLYSQFMNYFRQNAYESTRTLSLLISNLLHKSPNVQVSPTFFILKETDYKRFKVLGGFEDYFTDWFTNPSRPVYFLSSFSFESSVKKIENHFVTVMFLKENGTIKFRVLNSYDETIMSVDQEGHFLEWFIKSRFHTQVTYLPFTCPLLQKDLGPNCVQWSAFMILFLSVHPDRFDDPSFFLNSINKSSYVTIILFQLYFLFFQMSSERSFITKIVFSIDNNASHEYRTEEVDRLNIDREVRDACAFLFNITNCHDLSPDSCSAPNCIVCGNNCVNTNILLKNEDCKFMTLYDMVDELVVLQVEFVLKRLLPFKYSYSVDSLFTYQSVVDTYKNLSPYDKIRVERR